MSRRTWRQWLSSKRRDYMTPERLAECVRNLRALHSIPPAVPAPCWSKGERHLSVLRKEAARERERESLHPQPPENW